MVTDASFVYSVKSTRLDQFSHVELCNNPVSIEYKLMQTSMRTTTRMRQFL